MRSERTAERPQCSRTHRQRAASSSLGAMRCDCVHREFQRDDPQNGSVSRHETLPSSRIKRNSEQREKRRNRNSLTRARSLSLESAKEQCVQCSFRSFRLSFCSPRASSLSLPTSRHIVFVVAPIEIDYILFDSASEFHFIFRNFRNRSRVLEIETVVSSEPRTQTAHVARCRDSTRRRTLSTSSKRRRKQIVAKIK